MHIVILTLNKRNKFAKCRHKHVKCQNKQLKSQTEKYRYFSALGHQTGQVSANYCIVKLNLNVVCAWG